MPRSLGFVTTRPHARWDETEHNVYLFSVSSLPAATRVPLMCWFISAAAHALATAVGSKGRVSAEANGNPKKRRRSGLNRHSTRLRAQLPQADLCREWKWRQHAEHSP